ncbi:transglutaminase-like domain-containing protein [Candidatus Woesearchaeota archaeon]|jgi:hypothetical protein|nr:transglutaminase-like domain-containing protein [Candidatus Woesearchaeota archaeon]
MREEDLIEDAKRAEKELHQEHRHHTQKTKDKPSRRNMFSYLTALLLLLLIIMMVVPYYGLKLDPSPKNIPLPEEVMPNAIDQLTEENPGLPAGSRANMRQLLMPDHQSIRNTAAMIATASCRESNVCYSKALFYFVRDNFQYVGDPPNNYLESPFETLQTRGADCDGLAILLANFQSAVGIPTRFAFIPGHVYVQVKIDSAPKKYKEKDGWISLDPTCSSCEFGEVPYTTIDKQKEFLYI